MIVRLTYSHVVTEKPVLAEAILKTGLPINLLEGKITAQKGELIVSVPAAGEKLQEVLTFFRKSGVQVQKYKVLQIDHEKCVSCGACISPCPTKALSFDSDWTLEFEETKCVACRTCITACPIKAITMP